MLVRIYAGYIIDSKRLHEWSEAQTDPEYVRCREEHHSVTFLTILHYFRLRGWSQHIGVTVFPHPMNQIGGMHESNWNTMFYRREREYDVPLRRFSDWDRYNEQEADLQHKQTIEKLGLEAYGDVSQWKVVAWVGRIGVFYDFSPQVLDGICERRAIARAKKAEQAGEPNTVGADPSVNP